VSNAARSFVEQLAEATTPDRFLAAEAAAERGERFARIDELMEALLRTTFDGGNIVQVDRSPRPGTPVVVNTVRLASVVPGQAKILADSYLFTDQQARGAWWLPDDVSLKTGLLNLPATMLANRRFPMEIAREDHVTVALATNPDGFFIWAAVQGLFDLLLAPLELRGEQVGKNAEEHARHG
jgi:hypothetical protein